MPSILGANTLSSGYDVDNSLRFSKASSTGLELDLGTPTNAKKYTISFWIKREVNGSGGDIIAGGTNGSNETFIRMNANGLFQFKADHGSATSWAVNPNALGRDPSAWYHYVAAVDTTQGTASNRVKIYLNGVLQSLGTANYPDEDHASDFLNNDNVIHIGKRNYDSSVHFGGYLCEFVFLDGQTLDSTSFGEFDSDSGIWKPINGLADDLTFGDNGFYLEFKQSGTSQNSSGLGADTSGNDNHFAVENLTAVNQSTDTCTNNFATINPLYTGLNANFGVSEGNLKGLNSGDGENNYVSTIGVSSGKWYFEGKANVAGNDVVTIGIVATDSVLQTNGSWLGSTSDSFFYNENGSIGTNGSASTTGLATYADNDIIGVRVNLDDNELHFYKNGTIITNTALSITANKEYFFGGRVYTNATGWEFNFGSPAYAISSGNADADGHGNFEYAVPSGYFALCSKNLAEYG